MRRYLSLGYAVIAAGAVATWLYARFDPCDTAIERVVPSPDNSRPPIVFHRDCGATVDFNTQVSLVPSGQQFSFDRFPAVFQPAVKAI
jgi:hypothetical protein